MSSIKTANSEVEFVIFCMYCKKDDINVKIVVRESSGAVVITAFINYPEAFNNRKTAFIITDGKLDSKHMKNLINEKIK